MVDKLAIRSESWPILGGFAISREVKNTSDTVIVEMTKDGITGQGECVPLKRYHHTQESVIKEIKAVQDQILKADRFSLQKILPPGPARNAVDCAFWDWESKKSGQSIANLAGLSELSPLTTAYTLSLDTPNVMAENAASHQEFSLLKMKMNGTEEDINRIKSVKGAAPKAKLILDANEAWSIDHLQDLLPLLVAHDVVLIEQPLPEKKDDALKGFSCPIPIAADESCHSVESLPKLVGKYQIINIKLDKTGGLTHALELKNEAQKMGFGIMVGCMASTSLGILPALVVGQGAEFCDLDGAFLLEKDPYQHVLYKNGQVFPA